MPASEKVSNDRRVEMVTPALVVDLDTFEQNLAAAETLVLKTGKLVRPHLKTHRTPGLALRQLGPSAAGVCCATIGEAEAAVNVGINDILLANEFVTAEKLARIAALASRARVMVAVDAEEQVHGLSSAARQQGTTVDVLVDVDVGLGRCGVRNPSEASVLAKALIHARGLRFAGIMGYEGRVRAAVPDRSEKISRAFRTLAQAKDCLQAAGLEVPVVSGAGTSTLIEALQDPHITEIQAGSYALMEPDLEPLGLPFRCAVSVLGTIISRSAGCIVLDAGWRAMGCEYGPPIPLDGCARTKTLGDEHTVLEWDGDLPPLGARVALRPSQNRTTFNLHRSVWLSRSGRVIERLPIAAASSW